MAVSSNRMKEIMETAAELAGVQDVGELSDGFHTFNSLYKQRCVLFATLVNLFPDLAWKSRRHEDGEPCFGEGGSSSALTRRTDRIPTITRTRIGICSNARNWIGRSRLTGIPTRTLAGFCHWLTNRGCGLGALSVIRGERLPRILFIFNVWLT